jgi:hypothetical protein
LSRSGKKTSRIPKKFPDIEHFSRFDAVGRACRFRPPGGISGAEGACDLINAHIANNTQGPNNELRPLFTDNQSMDSATKSSEKLKWDIWYCEIAAPMLNFLAVIATTAAGFFLIRLHGDLARLRLVFGALAGAFISHATARYLKRHAVDLERQLAAVNPPAQNPRVPSESN